MNVVLMKRMAECRVRGCTMNLSAYYQVCCVLLVIRCAVTQAGNADFDQALPVRLVNGGLPYQGQVEIFHLDRWGTVCDDFWDLRDANVVCRQLGFPGASLATSRARFGRGTGLIWMAGVNCRGNERGLSLCSFRGWGFHNCGHAEDAGVICLKPTCRRLRCNNGGRPYCDKGQKSRCHCRFGYTGSVCETEMNTIFPVRLVNGGYPYQGRVEISYLGRWGTVCDDNWNMTDANVVCRQLGFPGARSATSRARFGRGWGQIWMDDVNCEGSEKALSRCPFRGWARNDCSHAEDAGVICSCGTLTCYNGGTQICSRSGRPFCSCSRGFSGRLCQMSICPSCYNGGVQSCSGNAHYCICPRRYVGNRCQLDTCRISACPTTAIVS